MLNSRENNLIDVIPQPQPRLSFMFSYLTFHTCFGDIAPQPNTLTHLSLPPIWTRPCWLFPCSVWGITMLMSSRTSTTTARVNPRPAMANLSFSFMTASPWVTGVRLWAQTLLVSAAAHKVSDTSLEAAWGVGKVLHTLWYSAVTLLQAAVSVR